MTNATYGLNHFNAGDFIRLSREYPVSWAVIHGAAPSGMDCPYQQRGYAVCKISGAREIARGVPEANGKHLKRRAGSDSKVCGVSIDLQKGATMRTHLGRAGYSDSSMNRKKERP